MTRRLVTIVLLSCAWIASMRLFAADFQGATHLVPIDEETISYAKTQPDSAIAAFPRW